MRTQAMTPNLCVVAPSVFPFVTKNRRNVLCYRFSLHPPFFFLSFIHLFSLCPPSTLILWFSNSIILHSRPPFNRIASPSLLSPPSLNLPSLYVKPHTLSYSYSLSSVCRPLAICTLTTFSPFFISPLPNTQLSSRQFLPNNR